MITLKKRTAAIFFLWLIFTTTLFSTPISSITIALGSEQGQISRNADNWTSLFFSIHEGNYYIPDYFSKCIQVFNQTGILQHTIGSINAINPRMRYFGIASSSYLIIFSDNTLYCLNINGQILWNMPFPLGLMPQSFLCGPESLFILFSINNEYRTLAIPYATADKAVMLPTPTLRDTITMPSGITFAWQQEFTQAHTDPSSVYSILKLGQQDNSFWIAQNVYKPVTVAKIRAEDGNQVFLHLAEAIDTTSWFTLDFEEVDKQTFVHVLTIEADVLRISKYSFE